MKVSTTQPFQVVYSIFEHEFLGYLLGAFVVQVNTKEELTYQFQTISYSNIREFEKMIDEVDVQLIELVDAIQQDYIIKKFYNKKVKPAEFFLKIYDKEKGDKILRHKIDEVLESRRHKILQLIKTYDKPIFVMSKDGYPAWKRLHMAEEPASVLFHFRRNEKGTHYFPTLKYKDEKLDFQYKNAFILCKKPAWMVLHNTLFTFTQGVDGNKLKPFLNKNHIEIPRQMESEYYRKFIAPLIASFDVFAQGFTIKSAKPEAAPVLSFTEYQAGGSNLFGEELPQYDILFELDFEYGEARFSAEAMNESNEFNQQVNVRLEESDGEFIFHRIHRKIHFEQKIIHRFRDLGLDFKKGSVALEKGKAFGWIARYASTLQSQGIAIRQNTRRNQKYFLGKPEIKLQITENIDWFDIQALIRFGEFEIPFLQLRKWVLQKKAEFILPNGEIAIIPEEWLEQYSELFTFAEEDESQQAKINKHYWTVIDELRNGELAQVIINRKLEKLRDFESIEDYPLPKNFKGELRPYQKAGYNWLQFLHQYRFGGCLADDMGLGKTVVALCLLQAQRESTDPDSKRVSLLVMPTSLIYNWELEARRFTPNLRLLIYSGSNRKKNMETFDYFDVVITSYGIIRQDTEVLKKYQFNYIILDESQAIKNPNSNISIAVRELNSRHRLILTGTPLENSTLDLWSQISFINPGLLGTANFFRNEYLNPIEKKQDFDKLQKLGRMIKPFILRRLKSQVAVELPPKIEQVQYCLMSKTQEEEYERVKSQYRNEILKHIEQEGMAKSQFLLLQGLTRLRQIANHPRLADVGYQGDSGKLENVCYRLESVISEDSKVLIFSQFVKHLEIVKEYIEEQGWEYAYLDGATRDRQAEVEKFQQQDKVKIFLISLRAGGVGLNLTAAEYVFLLDPWWNPAIEAQAIDRAYRIGQTRTVFTYKFISKNSVEEKIMALQQNKRQLAQDLIATEDGFMKQLSKEDVLNLLD
jgi:SNF2 family DNA or RNA helicase